MSAFQHQRSGPQESPAPPPNPRGSTLPTHERDLQFHQRGANHTGPVYSGDPHGFSGHSIQPPSQINMPPYRAQSPQGYLAPNRLPYIPRQQQLRRHESLQLPNYGSTATASSVESPQAPELPPKPHSGLQVPPHQQIVQQQQQQQQHHLQQQQQQQQYYHQYQHHQHHHQQQHIEPYSPPPPPVPARPSHQLAVEAVAPHRTPSPEKLPASGRLNGAEPNMPAQLEELCKDPSAVVEKLKRVAEVLTAFPRQYETAIQGKIKMLQESILLGQQDLRLLREELQKTKSSLVTSQEDTHTLMGELEILKHENTQLTNIQDGSLSEPCYTDEETQLLIADLRNEIVNLKSEVPDPNLCDSLRLMIKLLEEDRKLVERKYTQVCEDLHSRDNEISRLMKEHEASGNIIQEGRTGLEKHFTAQLEELRRERNSLRHQMEIANQKLEVSQRRDAAESEPGPSRVELQGIIESANNFQDQLQASLRERGEEITRLKKQLVDSRQVISSSHTVATSPSPFGRMNSPVNSGNSYSNSEMESKMNEEILGLKIENKNLSRELSEVRKSSAKDSSLTDSDRLERELGEERERVRRYERLIIEKETELAQLQTSMNQGHKDSDKDDMIATLLGTKTSLSQQVNELKQNLEDQKQLKNEVLVLRNWVEGRDMHIQRLTDSMTQQNKELGYCKRVADEYNKRCKNQFDYCNKLKEDLAKSDNSLQWFKQRARDLEAKQTATPDFNTAKEVYDAHVEQLAHEIDSLRGEKKEAQSLCSEREAQIKKLESALKDLSVEFAQFKNERQQHNQGYGPSMYYMQDMSGAARIPDPYHAPRGTPTHREFVQGRDTGVPYPNPKK